MNAIVERYIAAQRKQIVAAFENWWDKYRITLAEIEDTFGAVLTTAEIVALPLHK